MHPKEAKTTNAAPTYIRELETALINQGLIAKGYIDARDPFLWARNPADARLTQIVVLADRDGDLAWHWQWTGRETNSDVELEYLCPAKAIAEASERISRVLSLAAT